MFLSRYLAQGIVGAGLSLRRGTRTAKPAASRLPPSPALAPDAAYGVRRVSQAEACAYIGLRSFMSST
jgi:hypothetical protein